MGTATVSASTLALAPGYVVETETVGGVMSGVCSTGRNGIAIAADEHDDDRDHHRENRPVDKKAAHEGREAGGSKGFAACWLQL